ncbi:trypsin-like peptidase domain-containing protein [Candidatus Peregrinibacteria bacterium]|nr:trypsin-like peptidase domain-containing protein [Candidatus Peregrinibacteria bacterium]
MLLAIPKEVLYPFRLMENQPADSPQLEILPDDIELTNVNESVDESYRSTRRSFLRTACSVLGIAGAGGALGYQQWQIIQLKDRVASLDRVRQGLPPDLIELIERTLPSVTRIDRIHKQFWDPHHGEDTSGSGFFLHGEKNTVLMTAGHVIWDPLEDHTEGVCTIHPSWNWNGFASAPRTLPDGRHMYLDRHKGDMAALDIPAGQAIPDDIGLTLRDVKRDPLKQGERVIAMGSPFGLDQTVTDGIISNTNVYIPMKNIFGHIVHSSIHRIQISAPLNSGNSGGPIVDMQGRVVGMATMVVGGSNGIGIATRADSIAETLREWRLA